MFFKLDLLVADAMDDFCWKAMSGLYHVQKVEGAAKGCHFLFKTPRFFRLLFRGAPISLSMNNSRIESRPSNHGTVVTYMHAHTHNLTHTCVGVCVK